VLVLSAFRVYNNTLPCKVDQDRFTQGTLVTSNPLTWGGEVDVVADRHTHGLHTILDDGSLGGVSLLGFRELDVPQLLRSVYKFREVLRLHEGVRTSFEEGIVSLLLHGAGLHEAFESARHCLEEFQFVSLLLFLQVELIVDA